jgi:hypothetical protein
MAKLDHLKEEIAYLKYWQGIMAVADGSVIGWLVTSSERSRLVIFALAVVALIALSWGVLALHRRIARRIKSTARL